MRRMPQDGHKTYSVFYPAPDGKVHFIRQLKDPEAERAWRTREIELDSSQERLVWERRPEEPQVEETPSGTYIPRAKQTKPEPQEQDETDTATETNAETEQESGMLGTGEDLSKVYSDFVRTTR